jgi:hypothetical protein
MAALRKTFLAVTAIAVVTTTASSVFAQNQPSVPQAASCSIQGVPTLMRYQGLTEYIGDIVVTCVGGTPTLKGVQVPTVNFQVDMLNQTNFTSRLLGFSTPAANGGFPMNEAILAINEPVPPASMNNPANAGQSSPYGVIHQSICSNSNTTGDCLNTGNGLGGWGNGSAGSSYAVPGNFNVYQGYIHTGGSSPGSNKEVRFDGIPFDAPGSTGTIEFRITNLRIDATYFSGAGPGIQVPVYATVTITGTQPPAVAGTNSPLVGYATNGIVAPAPTEVGSPICGTAVDFVVPIQEGFASSFKRRTWFTDNFTSPDPTNMNGSGIGNIVGGTFTKYSTQNIFSYGYFTESNWFDNDTNGQANLRDGSYASVGLATNGTRLYVTLTNINPGVTVTAPAYAGLWGGTPLIGTAGINFPSVYSPGASVSPSGILYLVGMSPPYPSDGSGYLNTSAHASPISFAAATGSTSTTFVYEVLTSDPAYIETAYIDFTTKYATGIASPIPPLVLSSSVGFAPIGATPTVGDVPDSVPIGVNAYPRFVPGQGPAQPDWYLAPCQCDLLFPYVVTNSEFETGMAIANTSSDPYDTLRSPGYVELFYYEANMIKAGTPAGPIGNDGTRSDFTYTTTNWIAPGDMFLYVLGYGSSTTSANNPGTGFPTAASPTKPTVGPDAGIPGVPGFEGYIFAVTSFRYCHGYAFIQTRDNGLAEGYLPLVVDEGSKLGRGPGTPGAFVQPEFNILGPGSVPRNEYNN